MKRKIFTLGLLSLAFSANAQSLLGVQDQASLHIKEDALIYSGGELKTVADGVIDNFGNVMIVGGGFKTVTASNTNKTNGGNFILRLWSNATTNGSIVNGGTVIKYGQLYIDNQTTQAQVTGIVDKEYKDNAHGAYQQMAIPFYKKKFSELSTELNANLSGNRRNKTGILVWNNSKVRFDHFTPSDNTTDILLASTTPVENSGATTYYAIGSMNFNAFSGGNLNSLSTKVFTIKGVPFAGTIIGTLTGAGQNVDFGPGGKNTNYFRERYNSYLGDHWEHSTNLWTGNYGKNIYQFGNPYLTNINLKYLGAIIDNLMGVRVEPSISVKATGAETGGVYVSYNNNGVAIGDVKQVIVRPMGTFEIKLSGPSVRVLDFGQLRKFAYEANTSNTSTYNGGVTVQSKSSNKDFVLSELSTNSTVKIGNAKLSNSSVKQLGVIALDADGKELGRTYYVVYADGVSGQPTKFSSQVTANSKTIIGTFEESKKGGVDEDLINSYWLYINEANENDFKGKEVPMRVYSSDVKSLVFEILENAEDIADGQERLSSGESFYIFDGKKHVLIGNNKKISISSTDAEFGLYYGKPAELASQKNTIATIQKPSATILAYDESIAAHKILFDPEWKKATVQVFDLSGRLILSQANVDATKGEFVVNLPSAVRGTYVVTAVSETGKKFSQKVIK